MLDLMERGPAAKSTFTTRKVNLDDGSDNRSKAQDVPPWIAVRAQLANQQLQASLFSAVHLVAQMKMISHDKQSDGINQLMAEIVDDWCSTQMPSQFPPRPHWSSILEQLALLSGRYAPGSVLHDAVFELGRRVLTRAQELSKQSK